ncbi:BZ3500_MvSof-1268-A1-R1_Chr11-3g03532 [Microbotryum saponariae]|uniref:BZ3500_MvSof-1268-A1-R1_Chr11-3g03532 protein n=1 Tax=Microbotryum saponariae TaxID=289078 RepID=A0A2X0L9K6_9BASI|nr:BZ3500_MvSof-1268-A1-R1_Chr11-3g03532 [Microbotryum saponariae]SDA03541.1 BZ3501_MvSof-1269-A2-R1_Chr11g03109 [Microbotryum saponariae]
MCTVKHCRTRGCRRWESDPSLVFIVLHLSPVVSQPLLACRFSLLASRFHVPPPSNINSTTSKTRQKVISNDVALHEFVSVRFAVDFGGRFAIFAGCGTIRIAEGLDPQCCACPETKKARDDCFLRFGSNVDEAGSSAQECEKIVEAHRRCMRSLGFNV